MNLVVPLAPLAQEASSVVVTTVISVCGEGALAVSAPTSPPWTVTGAVELMCNVGPAIPYPSGKDGGGDIR